MVLVAVTQFMLPLGATAQEAKRPPNFVVIFTDDQGYQDLGCFGSPEIETPNIDRMAREGMRFTDFYVSQAVCSASRAALMTGCYSNRVSILGALGPKSPIGIHDDEWTIAEVLKQADYATAIYGKWHLGHHPRFLPMRHGFDDYFGLPYSNDMWPQHPTNKSFPDLPLINRDEIVEYNPDQRQLTTWYTEHAVKFIEEHQDEPFFVYLPHSMPHVPLFVSEKYRGNSRRGLYGDVISEIDWSVGQVLETLKRCGVDDRTLVWFTSDNGPWLSYGDHGGSALPLREGKGTTWEGGMREPCVVRYPGHIPAGTECHELAATIDILPTLASLAGVELPQKHKIDGADITPLLLGQADAKTPHEAYYYYWGRHLQAIRGGQWKLHFPHPYRSLAGEPGSGGRPGPIVQKNTALELYDLKNDIGETTNVADQHPDVVNRLKELADQARADLGDSATKQQGDHVRPPGRVRMP
jgi:arylsulfatase A-like enzyme